jgi:dihydrolipoamide dehydrogenase
MGLEGVGVEMTSSGHIVVDRVSRTSVRGIYAAGDCTNGFALASVAAMQGRLAMRHSLGDAVMTLNSRTVCANVFTMPEIATVGIGQKDIDEGRLKAHSMTLSLHGNARSKMTNSPEGFVKLFCLPTTHIVVGAVVVSDIASELIYSISLAVRQKLTVEQMTEAFAVYPSLSGSIAEAARQLRGHDEGDVVLY